MRFRWFENDATIITRISANAIRVHQLETQKIHHDTTSLTLFGSYDNPHQDESVLPAYGYNKDGHADCKQIVFGLNITEDGHVPISYQIYDGNTVDSDIHVSNWDVLRQQLKTEKFIYTSDGKLCGMENMAYIAKNGGQFIMTDTLSKKVF